MQKPKLNTSRLTEEQREKLERWNQTKQQIQSLEDLLSIVSDISRTFDETKSTSKKTSKEMGALLVDIRGSLKALQDKEAPDVPDYAKPVVKAVEGLEKALTKTIKSIDVKPDVKVEAPNVTATADVDLSKVEEILKTDLPKAFEKAIKQVPKTEIPKANYSPLIEVMTELSSKLDSIDTGVRMKPQGVNAKITNVSDLQTDALTDTELRATPVPVLEASGLVPAEYDYISLSYTGSNLTGVVYKTGGSGGTTVATLTLAYTGSVLDTITKT